MIEVVFKLSTFEDIDFNYYYNWPTNNVLYLATNIFFFCFTVNFTLPFLSLLFLYSNAHISHSSSEPSPVPSLLNSASARL